MIKRMQHRLEEMEYVRAQIHKHYEQELQAARELGLPTAATENMYSAIDEANEQRQVAMDNDLERALKQKEECLDTFALPRL
jgi:hypothetical protein